MLVICNGVFKSGSSWLHAILLEIFRVKKIQINNIPEKYNPDIKSPDRILEKKLFSFLRDENYTELDYITKSHYFSNQTIQHTYPDQVKFIFIERDIKDAIVSHFHHFNNYRKKEFSFNKYFKLIGVFKAYEICLFNTRCKQNFDSHLFFSFERLKSDFNNSVIDLCSILNISDISESEILEIKENTSLKKMQNMAKQGGNKYYPELGKDSYKLFRKGNIGDWKHYYIESDLKLINRIVQLDAPFYVRIGYFLMFTLRRKIGF